MGSTQAAGGKRHGLRGSLAALLLVWTASGGAQERSAPAPLRSGWSVTPYLWVPSIKGPVGAGNTRQNIDLSGSDLLGDAKGGGMGLVSWSDGRHYYYLEAAGASWQDDTFDSFFAQNVDSSVLFVEVGYGQHFTFTADYLPEGLIWLTPYAGVRYAAMDVEIGLNRPIETFLENPEAVLAALENNVPMSADEEVVDPAVGLKATLPVSERLRLSIKADGAGFSLGRTQYSNFAATLGYDLSRRWNISGGYRSARIKARAGGDNVLNLDWRLRGPLVAVAFRI